MQQQILSSIGYRIPSHHAYSNFYNSFLAHFGAVEGSSSIEELSAKIRQNSDAWADMILSLNADFSGSDADNSMDSDSHATLVRNIFLDTMQEELHAYNSPKIYSFLDTIMDADAGFMLSGVDETSNDAERRWNNVARAINAYLKVAYVRAGKNEFINYII